MSLFDILLGKRSNKRQVSVILKRQVPIRFDMPARSWLGGLPMMPEGTKWPRAANGAPLFFLAQICCEDLPAMLWNGRGPRTGWLLLFSETMELGGGIPCAGSTQILHTKTLGIEHEPPQETPTVRHTMSDYIDWSAPVIRPGVPKFWRKWPLDLVVQEYVAAEGEDEHGFPCPSAEDLYGVSAAEVGVFDGFKFLDLNRPMTWRGVLYVLQGIVRDLDPKELRRTFTRARGLLGAPEPDTSAYVAEWQKRFSANLAAADGELGWGPRVDAIKEAIEDELKAERQVGWFARSYAVLDKERLRYNDRLAAAVQKLDAAEPDIEERHLDRLKSAIASEREQIERIEFARDYLNEIFSQYPGDNGEQVFTDEIRKAGEAHLAWCERVRKSLLNLIDHVLERDLEAPVSTEAWQHISSAIEAEKSWHWVSRGLTVLEKVEHGLSIDRHLKMAIREDILDIYTRSPEAHTLLPESKLAQIEQQLRHIEEGLPHRMGGTANSVQGKGDTQNALMFQLATDAPMGWMWGDVGALYVTLSEGDLRKGRFDRVHAKIEGH